MPTYRYRCAKDHEFLVWRSIHSENLREYPCDECSRIAVNVMASPAIAAEALPNKKHGVIAKNRQEREWDRDMPAYKRLRRDGIQPKGIDGAADLETRCEHPLEFEMGKKLGKEVDIRRAQEVASELMGNDLTTTGSEIGAAKREKREVKAGR